MKQVIVILSTEAGRRLEEDAQAADTSLSRHITELLEEYSDNLTRRMSEIEMLKPKKEEQLSKSRSAPASAPASEPSKTRKRPAAPAAKAIKTSTATTPKPRGLAAFDAARRSEIALKAAATRKLRAEEAERKTRRSKH